MVKTPAPANPIPIPYPNIGKGAEKPDSKARENEKRVGKDFDRKHDNRYFTKYNLIETRIGGLI